VLGSINLQGKTRDEVATYIQAELVSHDLVKDPVVIVDFLNRGVSVLGEVAKPGRITFDRDRITILDALAEAGDLNITGKRTDVLVMRRVGNQELTYRVDLTNSESVLNSPAYYLQQDDVVYVSPTDVRKRQTTANGNSPLTPSFWISILSLLATVAVLVFN
jgi:polysaccharide export outer membrane protein